MTDDETPRTRPALPGEYALPRPRTRAVASLIDLLAAGVLGVGAAALVGGWAPAEITAGVVVIATALPTYLLAAVTGRSLGKSVMQLRHVRPGDELGAAPDLAALLVRWGLKWLVPTMVVLVAPTAWGWALGLWVLDGLGVFVGERRALHDRVAGTRVWELVTHER